MRFSENQSREEFLEAVERFFRDETQSLRTAALVNPKRFIDWEGTWRLPRELDQLLILGIWSWYVDDECICLLRDQLRQLSERNSDLFALRFVTQTRAIMEGWLLETNRWHTRDFFGNVISTKNLKKLSHLIKPLWTTKRKPTRTVRRRGYKDKGSLRSEVSPNRFIDTTSEMNQLEQDRRTIDDTELFLLAFYEWDLGTLVLGTNESYSKE